MASNGTSISNGNSPPTVAQLNKQLRLTERVERLAALRHVTDE